MSNSPVALIQADDIQPTHPEHLLLSEYLSGIAPAAGLIDWSDLRPENFPAPVFPSLVVYEVVTDDSGHPIDFVYRIMGDRLVEFAKINMTGKPLSDFPYENIRESLIKLMRICLDAENPVFAKTYSEFVHDKSLHTERSFYPLRRDGRLGILALVTVTKPPIPFADLYSAATVPPADREHYRILTAVHRWGLEGK